MERERGKDGENPFSPVDYDDEDDDVDVPSVSCFRAPEVAPAHSIMFQ